MQMIKFCPWLIWGQPMFGHSAISNEVKIMVLLLTTENLYFLEWRCHDTSSFTYLWGFLPRHSSINSKGKIHSKFLSNLLLLRNQTERFFSNILPQRLFNSIETNYQSASVFLKIMWSTAQMSKNIQLSKKDSGTHSHDGYKKSQDND